MRQLQTLANGGRGMRMRRGSVAIRDEVNERVGLVVDHSALALQLTAQFWSLGCWERLGASQRFFWRQLGL